MIGLTSSLAGCSLLGDDDPDPTEDRGEPVAKLDSDALSIVHSELMSFEEGDRRFLRVITQNESEDVMPVVGIMAEFFDVNLDFIEVQSATIEYLQPGEAFDGYIQLFSDDIAAYSLQTDRSRRHGEQVPLEQVYVAEHCLVGGRVEGSLGNDGTATIPRLRIRATFSGPANHVLGSASTTITELAGNEERTFAISAEHIAPRETGPVTHYELMIGDYNETLLAVG